MEIEKLKLERKFFNGKSARRNDERVCKKSEIHLNRRSYDSNTTNIIEGLNRQFRQITKNKPSFTNDDSLRKMLYLESQKIVERWTQRCRNWDVVLSQLSIIFEDRIPA